MRWGRGIAAGGVLLTAVYLLAVCTAAGQRFEDVILESAQGVHSAPVYGVLDAITVWSLTAMVAVVVVIGLLRGLPDLAVAGGGVIVCTVAAAELLRAVLPRPLLLAHGFRREDHSFPSGHTAMAVSVMCALVLVVPARHRAVTAGLSAVWAVGVGALTVAASWHRPSDTIGSDLIALICTAVAVAWLTRRGTMQRSPARLGPLAWLFGTVSALATIASIYNGHRVEVGLRGVWDPAELKLDAAVAAGRSIALAAGALTALVLLLTVRGVDVTPPSDRPGATGRERGRPGLTRR